jgi:flagella basal body P-ring formation protein FlgA
MYNGNGRPLGKKKQVQLMVALTILAWATQTLRHQWGFGAEVDVATPDAPQIAPDSAPADSAPPDSAPPQRPFDVAPTTDHSQDADDAINGKETFVPGEDRFANGATLELRSAATIVGGDIKLKQICRWTDQDTQVFAPIADFVIDHIKSGSPFRTIRIADLKSTLRDAGINLATIDIVGCSSCTVSRSDIAYDQQSALDQWIDSKKGSDNAPATQPTADAQQSPRQNPQLNPPQNPWADASAQGVTVSTTPAVAASAITASATQEKQYHTLRELLTLDLATRTSLPADQLEMNFRAEDEKVLKLSEPSFRFQIDPLRARNLGDVAWNVTILAAGESHRVTIKAEGRAWQQQMVLTRPIDSREVIQPGDFVQRRTLVDSLPNEPLLSSDQLVNEQAAESLKPGTVMTSRMVDAVPLAKPGQLVTVSISTGGVKIKTVATAMEAGGYGQTIRVRNETTRDVFDVTLTGPQEATLSAADSTRSPVAAAQ